MRLKFYILSFICIALELSAQDISKISQQTDFISNSPKLDLLPKVWSVNDTSDLAYSGVISYSHKTIGIGNAATFMPKSGTISSLYSEGIKQLNKVNVSGYVKYQFSKYNGIKWYMRNPEQRITPLIIADSIKSDWRINTLTIAGRIALSEGSMRPDLSIGYKTSNSGKDIDPRSESKLMQVQTEPGFKWLIDSNTQLQTSLLYSYQKEDIDVIHNGQTTESSFFKFLGYNLMQVPQISPTFNYRYTTNTAGSNISLTKSLNSNTLKIDGNITESFTIAKNDPYGYNRTADNQVLPTSSEDALMVQIFNSLSATYRYNRNNNATTTAKLFFKNNKGSVLNQLTKRKIHDNKWTESGFDLTYATNKYISEFSLAAKYTTSENSTKHLVKEAYNYFNISSYLLFCSKISSTINFRFTPVYLYEYHTNNNLQYLSVSPFIRNNTSLIHQIFTPNYEYFGSNKHKATAKIEINTFSKKHTYFLRFMVTYVNICNTNREMWHKGLSIGLQY